MHVLCLLVLTVPILLATSASNGGAAAPARRKVRTLDDLPRAAFPVSGTAAALLASETEFGRFAEAVRTDCNQLLAAYDIQDTTTLESLEQTLLSLDLLAGRNDEVPARIERIRALEAKPGLRPTKALGTEAYLRAKRATGSGGAGAAESSPAFHVTFREELDRLAAALPWDEVMDVMESSKGQLEILGPGVLAAVLQAQIEPAIAKSSEVGRQLAHTLVELRAAERFVLPFKDDIVEVYGRHIAANRKVLPSIWLAREVVLDPTAQGDPVVVGIWDTGVDYSVFPGRSAPGGEAGIAWDLHHARSSDLLYPLGDAKARLPDMQRLIEGYFDLQASLDSPAASEVKQALAAATDPAVAQRLLEDLQRYAIYAHGTHVAGIAVEGNPFARLVMARITADPRMTPEPPSLEEGRAHAVELRETVDWFKLRGVRVVSMSWGLTAASEEQGLELNGLGGTPEERRRLGREIFEIRKTALYEAIAGAPDILFVGAAGNSDNDVSFEEFVPPAFDLPNLLIAGAVDQAGNPTNFTSFGDNVKVYSNGFEVESPVPGGRRMKFPGTSMSAPQVTNLAAKILSVAPRLTPPQVAGLILRGTEAREGEPKILLLHPARSLELARALTN